MKNQILLLQLLFISFVFSQKKIEKQTPHSSLFFASKSFSEKEALNQFSKAYHLNEDYSYQSLYENTDRKGQKHHKFQQFYKGIKIEFGTAITHSIEGKVTHVNGELYDVSAIPLNPSINSEEGLNKALANINATSYLWENEDEAHLMNYNKPKGTLVYFPNQKTNTIHLAYKYDIYTTQPISRQEVYVDAHTGNLLFSNQIIKHVTAKNTDKAFQPKIEIETKPSFVLGTAATRYSGTRSIETTFDAANSNYILRDQTRGLGIFTFNCQNSNSFQNIDFTDNDNNWTDAEYNNAAKDNGALDAHWGAERTYDFWSEVFGRNSYDDNGGIIRSYVHFGTNYNNAGWNGFAMSYGDGSSFDILTSIDVCGHEIGHAVCTYTANLVYQNESGAMNEGFSDIWGACIEHYGRTGNLSNPISNNVWLIGEDLTNTGLRSMQNPNSNGDPDTYLGTYWYSGTADNGGVHTNSGVLNHWFYILTVGETGTNNAPSPDSYSVTGIGMEKASEIAYLAERDYLTPNATYEEARTATIALANHLYCANSPEAIAVTNAWYAVNVGEAYVAAADDIALQAIDNSNTILCTSSSVVTDLLIKNQGLNVISTATISYTIDGSNLVTETWNGNLAPCEEISYPITINGLNRGAHLLNVTTSILNDGRPENNTKETLLMVNDEGTVGLINTFSNSSDELIAYNEGEASSLWVRGIHTDSPTNAMDSNGNTVYTTNLSGNYPDETKAYLISQCYNLSSISNPEISFNMKYDLENNWDIVYVEYSTNFGANWQVLGFNDMANWTNWYTSDHTQLTNGNDCFNCPGAQWTGTNTTLTNYSYPLNALNNETHIIFRIVFHSDQAVNELGVNIDDFVVNGTLATNSFNSDVVMVYPNPSQGIYTLSLRNVEPVSITIYDVSGKTISTIQEIKTIDNKATLDLSKASKGIYFLVIQTQEGIVSKRIVKE
ncbi:T9SS type A sorting domain-containing protein [Flavobacterium sp. TP390]|uniref:T9SS type A sorting domain-containing protein n=1 Tax=Flavobacterium profundi TaxID=1774945 RepID=A0A6I4ISR0_9FLAO|nr:M4 family metallopeptidase [Flavobacterium profundi]MVO09547.1 T9SS type A sorting domain-containing protein [Flavobacterium profundi]